METFANVDELVKAIHHCTASHGQRFSFGVTGGGACPPPYRIPAVFLFLSHVEHTRNHPTSLRHIYIRCAFTRCCRIHQSQPSHGPRRRLLHRARILLHARFPALYNQPPHCLAHITKPKSPSIAPLKSSQIRLRINSRLRRSPRTATSGPPHHLLRVCTHGAAAVARCPRPQRAFNDHAML